MLMNSISKSTLKIKATQNVHYSKGKEISFSQRLDVIFFFVKLHSFPSICLNTNIYCVLSVLCLEWDAERWEVIWEVLRRDSPSAVEHRC